MIRMLLVAAYLIAPDCQRLCLGVCYYDWSVGYCQDSRVVRLGTWDPIPWGYVPPSERDFIGWAVPYPRQWGEYPLEREHSESYQP